MIYINHLYIRTSPSILQEETLVSCRTLNFAIITHLKLIRTVPLFGDFPQLGQCPKVPYQITGKRWLVTFLTCDGNDRRPEGFAGWWRHLRWAAATGSGETTLVQDAVPDRNTTSSQWKSKQRTSTLLDAKPCLQIIKNSLRFQVASRKPN